MNERHFRNYSNYDSLIPVSLDLSTPAVVDTVRACHSDQTCMPYPLRIFPKYSRSIRRGSTPVCIDACASINLSGASFDLKVHRSIFEFLSHYLWHFT